MKKLIPLVAILILFTSCDNPRSQRSISSSQRGDYEYGGSGSNPFEGFENGSNSGSNSGSGSATDSNIPTDATHCKFSTDGVNNFQDSSTHLGAYTLCQSSTDKNVFYFQLKTPPVSTKGDVSVCFIPHTTSGSTSIFVGNPMCSTFTNPKGIKKITFVKYNEYTNALINSVMFFKDATYYYPAWGKYMNTLDAYSSCMTQLAYGKAEYCTSFKQVNQYVLRAF